MCSLVYREAGVLCTRLTVWLPEQLTADVFTCLQGGWSPVYKTDSPSIVVA